MSTRIDRISEEVMKALAEAMREVKDPRVQNGLVSVVHCEVTNDLRYAKCYISVLGSEQQAKEVMKGLKSAAGWLRREVGHKVQLRYAPELVFELDNSITHGAHISEMLHELKNEGKLQGADDILILSHRRPDGDTAGCAGALCRALRQIGKTAYILENPEITKRYMPLIVPCYPPEGFQPQFVVSTDIAEEKLFPDTAEPYKGKVDLVIDHHRSNLGFGKQNLVRPDAGACAEVLYDVIMALGVKLTTDIAECVYIGVSTDTGCFKFSNTTAHTHAVAAACLTAGIDGGEINRALFETKTMPRFQMERIIFDTMEFYEDGAIAVAVLWRADIDRTGADMDDLDSIASLTRQIEGVQIGITLTENKDGTVKASVRTTKEMDASAICRKCGGGGHIRAAGASFDCGMDEAKAAILKAAQEQYHAAK